MRPSTTTLSIRYAFPEFQLFDCIAAIGELRISGPDRVTDLIPPDMAVISINLSGHWQQGFNRPDEEDIASAALHGPTSGSKWVVGHDGATLLIAVHPLAWPLWFDKKASQFANKSVPLSEGLSDADTLLAAIRVASSFEARCAAINAFFSQRPGITLDPEMPQRLMTMRMALADPDCASVNDLSQRVGISQTRVTRMAKNCFGFPPKILIRIARFRRMLHRADAHSYAVWKQFIEGQYSDQSHMIRDFQTFLGMSPGRYFALERPFVSAAFEEARRLLGQTPFEGDLKLAAE